MQALDDATDQDFWSTAPVLFEDLNEFSAELARSTDITDRARNRVRGLVRFIPSTPEPLSDVDPYLRDALLTAVIHALWAVDEGDRPRLRVAVERARQALRDLLDEHAVWSGGPKQAVVWLVHDAGLQPSELDEVLGVSDATVRRWAKEHDPREPKGEQADRAVVVAKMVNHLRHAMTPRGVIRWLQRAHPSLDDRRPIDELKDPDSYRSLIHLASGVRSVTAS